MIDIVELLKAVFYGIVEGITEWLPVSSTGHLILLEELMPLDVSEEFWSMFEVVIQLGAILAVIVLYFHRLNPFSPTKSVKEKQGTWDLWGKVIVAVLPAGVLGLLLDNWLDEHLYNYVTVAVTLILYGVAFLLVERSPRRPVIRTTGQITWSTALIIGLFQCLAMIPGTYHSGGHAPGPKPASGGGILLLPGHSHHAGRQPLEDREVPGRRQQHDRQ